MFWWMFWSSTLNDLIIKRRGVYFILGVQAGRLIAKGVQKRGALTLIPVTSSKELFCFRRKYQESWYYQLIHIPFSNPSIDVRILSQDYCVAIISLSLLSFIHSFYFAFKKKYNNSLQKYIKDNIQYSN